MPICVRFDRGTLKFSDLPPDLLEEAVWDKREGCHRAPAYLYAPLLRKLHRERAEIEDRARGYAELEVTPKLWRTARPFQEEALRAWNQQKGRGVVVLPTGSGKSHVGLMALLEKRRSTLIVCPTLDLVRQWHTSLSSELQLPIGVVGGGEHEVQPITVTTYDSAYLHMDRLGNQFGLVIFDECHHLPGESYAQAARMCLAPFRLGLTATLERADGKDALLDELVGPVAYRKNITDLAGHYLAEYDTERVIVELSDEERAEYEAARDTYLGFVRSQGIFLGSPGGFNEFVRRASRSEAGRRAHVAFRRQRALAFGASGKLEKLGELLHRHRRDRAIVFTEDNRTAYEISRRFLVPIITHQTKVKERTEILKLFHEGVYRAIVTSKVLNEGVDVPSANVAIVLSGSGSVMEHVQRLGRILRQSEDKRARLYELVSANTSETNTSERRRDHAAYQRPHHWGARR